MKPDGRTPAAVPQPAAPLPTWDGPEYAHVSPGRYDAVVTRCQGPTWVRRYRRWSLLIEFALLSENVRVCAFFNMGADPLTDTRGSAEPVLSGMGDCQRWTPQRKAKT